MRIAQNPPGVCRPTVRVCLTVLIVLASSLQALAGSVTQASLNMSSPTIATEVDQLSKSVAEVNAAIKDYQKRDLNACLAQLAKAVTAHPELPPAHALLAKLAFLSNDVGVMRPALERAVSQAPDHPEIYLLFGNLALVESRTTDAAMHFEKAKALAADNRWTTEQRQRFDRLCFQGHAAVAENRSDWKAAAQAFESWLALEPSNARAHQRLGIALFHLNRHDDAYKQLDSAAQQDPALEPADVMMGWLFTKSGNTAKADEWMSYAAKKSPDALPVQMAVTSWLLELGRAEEAQSHAEAAAKLDAKSTQVQRMLGLVARERKDFARSEAIFQALATESPGDSWARNQLALVLAEQGGKEKTKRALELAELSVRQNPKSVDSLVTLGSVYFRLARLEDAEKVLQTVFTSGKANSDAAYVLALVKSERGQSDKAQALLKTALSAPGLFVHRNDAQQCLERISKVTQK